MSTVLFLCTGNFYRSRFAEIYFNWLAAQRKSPWLADSRGLALDPNNIGPLSSHTRMALARMKIPLPEPLRMPCDIVLADLERADLIVAVKEAEHRLLMMRRFPEWADRVEYWHVHDLDCATSDQALPQLEQQVVALVERLHAPLPDIRPIPHRG